LRDQYFQRLYYYIGRQKNAVYVQGYKAAQVRWIKIAQTEEIEKIWDEEESKIQPRDLRERIDAIVNLATTGTLPAMESDSSSSEPQENESETEPETT
jgi:hypothetical protein